MANTVVTVELGVCTFFYIFFLNLWEGWEGESCFPLLAAAAALDYTDHVLLCACTIYHSPVLRRLMDLPPLTPFNDHPLNYIYMKLFLQMSLVFARDRNVFSLCLHGTGTGVGHNTICNISLHEGSHFCTQFYEILFSHSESLLPFFWNNYI